MIERPASDADLTPILRLVAKGLGEGRIPRSEEYWNWKHVQNPFGRSPIWVAEVADEIVGLRAFLRWEWEAGGKRIPAVRAVDTVTHPDWRGQGLFKSLTLRLVEVMKKEGVHFVFNTPNKFSRPGYLKMGWQQVSRTVVWIRPRVSRALASLISSRAVSNRPETIEMPDSENIPSSMDGLLAESGFEELLMLPAKGDRRLRTPKSLPYLHWRYATIPGFQYRARWLFNRGGNAAVIFRVVDRGRYRELRLSEFFVGQGADSPRWAARLITDSAKEFGATFMSAMSASGTRERTALLRAGFLPAPWIAPILTVRALNDRTDPNPLRRANWCLSIGDLELL